MKVGVQISGGMSKTWISDIANSDFVRQTMADAVDEVIDTATSAAEIGASSYWDFHYGHAVLDGKWGQTHIVWPTSPIARANPKDLTGAVKAEGFIKRSTKTPKAAE
jgi:hypothetical protein